MALFGLWLASGFGVAHADAPVPARALPPRRRVPVGVPPGGDAGARVAGGGRGSGTGRVPRPSAAGVLPARRAGRLVPAPARAGQLVRPGAADRAGRCAAVGPGDRRRAQPPAEPVPVHRRSRRRAADRGAGDRARRRRRLRDLPRGRQLHRTPPCRRDRPPAGAGARGGGPALGGDAARAAPAAREAWPPRWRPPRRRTSCGSRMPGSTTCSPSPTSGVELPLDTVVRMRWWRVPAGEVPHGFEAQVQWLYTWWERIDAWVDAARAGR